MPSATDTPAADDDPRLLRVVAFFEHLSPERLQLLAEVYHPEARFKDPFNEVQGLVATGRIFQHMFDTLDAPRFVVLSQASAGPQAFLTWDFSFRTRGAGGRAMRIHGATRLVFADDGRVLLHRDYWDAAEELYEKLPLLGGLMRWLKRRLAS